MIRGGRGDVQQLLRPGDGHVSEAALFFKRCIVIHSRSRGGACPPILRQLAVQRRAVRQNAFAGSDPIYAREFQPLGAVDRHEPNSIAVFLSAQRFHLAVTLGKLVRKADERLHGVKPLGCRFELLQTFLHRFLIMSPRARISAFQIFVIKDAPHFLNGIGGFHCSETANQTNTLFHLLTLKIT